MIFGIVIAIAIMVIVAVICLVLQDDFYLEDTNEYDDFEDEKRMH